MCQITMYVTDSNTHQSFSESIYKKLGLFGIEDAVYKI